MIGVATLPNGTLVDRALGQLTDGPRSAHELARSVLGLPHAPSAVADRIVVALLGADPRVRRLPDGRWSVVAAASGSPLASECAYAVVDVETTGAGPRSDRITEIAVVLVHGERHETIFETLINPERPIPAMATAVTRITDAMVRQAPTFAEVADQVIDVLAGRVFVAHNVRFDWSFLFAELRRARDLKLDGPRLCTVRLARKLVRGIESCSLDSLSHWFGLENPARHRAGGDARTTALLLRRLLALGAEHGVRTLHDLEVLQTRRAKKRRTKRTSLPTSNA